MSKTEELYVITLVATSAPVPLPVLDEPHFGGLAAFRSRRVEDGRERFRIHVGYFTSMGDAEIVLPLLRETYPWAFIGPAPQSNLGSLDDTGVARFRIVRPAGTTQAPAPVVAAAPAVQPAVPAKPVPVAAPIAAPSVAPAAAASATIVNIATARSASAAKPAAKPAAVPAASEPPLLPMQDAVVVPPAKEQQRYAVQLLWSNKPIDLTKIQNMGVFDGYLLYAVKTQPGGRRMFGVRLGFYDDALSARLVALYVRPAFKGVVIPVSAREVDYAAKASIRLAGGRQPRSRSAARDGWPRTAVSVAFTNATPADVGAQL